MGWRGVMKSLVAGTLSLSVCLLRICFQRAQSQLNIFGTPGIDEVNGIGAPSTDAWPVRRERCRRRREKWHTQCLAALNAQLNYLTTLSNC